MEELPAKLLLDLDPQVRKIDGEIVERIGVPEEQTMALPDLEDGWQSSR